jgi:hypothetical protein
MTGVKFDGRLGNQLFQYTFYKYLRANDPEGYVFFSNPESAYLARYFDLGKADNYRLTSKVYSWMIKVVSRLFRFKQIYVQSFVSPKPLKTGKKIIYNGFFQTDYYLRHIPDFQLPRLRDEYRRQFDEKFGQLFRENKIVVVHIRLTDYRNYGKRDISLPISYFQRQLSSIPDLDSYKVIFVSDDMPYVQQHFPARENYIFSSNSEILDFQLIMNANVAIISNSTFAWWASYLGKRGKDTIAPKNWLGFGIGREHPRGVMTDRFTWRDVV